MTCYIYSILNKNTNKRYIGSTINSRLREMRHFRELIKNTHHSKKLQNSFNKHGITAFSFEILEQLEVDIQEQYKREKYYIDKYNSCFDGYNMLADTKIPKDIAARLELRRKVGNSLSAAMKGKIPANLENMRKSRWRAILEIESGVIVREYENTRQAGVILEVDYRLIHNVLKGKTTKVEKHPNKIWRYKDEFTK